MFHKSGDAIDTADENTVAALKTAGIGGFDSDDTEQLKLLLEILGWTVLSVRSLKELNSITVRLLIYRPVNESVYHIVSRTRLNNEHARIAIAQRLPNTNQKVKIIDKYIHFIKHPLDLEELEQIVGLG
jgi:hypothetical protein